MENNRKNPYPILEKLVEEKITEIFQEVQKEYNLAGDLEPSLQGDLLMLETEITEYFIHYLNYELRKQSEKQS